MGEIGFNSEKIDVFFKGKYSDKDTSYVDKVFCDNDKERELRLLLSKQFDEILSEDDIDSKDLSHILYRIHYNINTGLSSQKKWSIDNIIKWTLRIAGLIILPLLVFIGIQSYKTYKETNLKKVTWIEIKAPAWTRAQF